MNATSSRSAFTSTRPSSRWWRSTRLTTACRSQRTRSSGSRGQSLAYLFDVSPSPFHQPSDQADGAAKDIREELPEKAARKGTSTWSRCPTSWSTNRGSASAPPSSRCAPPDGSGPSSFSFRPGLPSSRSLAYIEQCQERMFGFQVAVEFRSRVDGRRHATAPWPSCARATSVRGRGRPQGHKHEHAAEFEVPPANLAVVRFHGRNHRRDIKARRSNLRSVRLQGPRPGEWVPRSRDGEVGEKVHAS